MTKLYKKHREISTPKHTGLIIIKVLKRRRDTRDTTETFHQTPTPTPVALNFLEFFFFFHVFSRKKHKAITKQPQHLKTDEKIESITQKFIYKGKKKYLREERISLKHFIKPPVT